MEFSPCNVCVTPMIDDSSWKVVAKGGEVWETVTPVRCRDGSLASLGNASVSCTVGGGDGPGVGAGVRRVGVRDGGAEDVGSDAGAGEGHKGAMDSSIDGCYDGLRTGENVGESVWSMI